MRRLLAAALLCTFPLLAEEPVALLPALEQKRISIEASGNGRDSIILKLTASAPLTLAIPAGAQFRAESGEKQILLRRFETPLKPGSDMDAMLPAAALSSRNGNAQRSLHGTVETEPKLAKLLELFATQNDLPRTTAQLAIFIVLEDVTWPEWKAWLAPVWKAETPPKPHPTPAEVAQAVDAIAFARLALPEAKFRILADDDLKRLALRNPWARGKAMALYGLTVEDAITGDASLPPDLGKLLHTSPNDNCVICRQRQKEPAEIP